MKKNNTKETYIVGLGASAGGFEALQKFLEKLNTNENITYVIVQHLDPNQPTMLGTLLSKFTKLTILMIEQGQTPEPNKVYFCPPNKDLTMVEGKFNLTEPLEKSYPKPSINKFFESLAIEKKDKAIGVILSGTGSDGAKGMEAIHKYGGITIAEDEGAKYFSMPKAAIDTGVVDVVLPPELIAQGIPNVIEDKNYFASQYEVKGSVFKVFDLLNKKTNIDFSSYKENTILRRIKKRMSEVHKSDIDEYIQFLEKNHEELETLKNELLIIVTSFFRGEDAFKELEKHLNKLIADKKDENLRIWVPACATGEEAYTIAIIVKEIFGKLDLNTKVTIFATDVSDIAIESARSKVYNIEQMSGVQEKFVNKYFDEQSTGFRPKKELRDMIIFSKHDIIKDPPFSNLDLISCRNLLIYFNNELQKVIMSVFYYALRFGGLLFLGQSETVGNLNNLFSTLHSKNKLYKKTSEIPNITPETYPYVLKQNYGKTKHVVKEPPKINDIDFIINKAISDEYGKNGLVIDGETSTILYYKGDTSDFINQPKGIVTQDIFKLVKDYLKLDLRATLNEARKYSKVATSKKIRALPLHDSNFYVLIIAIPLQSNKLGDKTYFIIFEKVEEKELFYTNGNANNSNQSEVALLEEELASLKERLQITIEELETSNEELQSTNEELQSTNEELQSTNEELETSNEELQSTNEELQTVNDELSFKNRELEFAQKAFNNVLNSIKVDVLIVDTNLNIVKYTDGILKFFDISKTNFHNFSTVLLNATVNLPNLLDNLKDILNDDKEDVHYEVTLGQKIYLFRVHKISMGMTLSKSDDCGLVLSFLDRTEFFQKDRILFQQSKMASMGEMIGNIAHQWRQPLNVLGLTIATLLDKIEKNTLDKNYLDKFKENYKREITHMSGTIDDFKNFFEPTKEYGAVSLNLSIDQAVLMMEDSFRYNQIDLNISLKKDNFYGSQNELAQVLLNIFTNSKDAFISNNIQKRNIEISSEKKDKYIVLKILDNAGGVDPKYLEHIEEPYFTTKKNQGGSGIGLYMSKMIVEQMGGKIEFHNNEEKNGLEVIIFLLNKKEY